VLDEQDICMGCYRSADEITDWFLCSNEKKTEVLRLAQERRDADTSIKLF